QLEAMRALLEKALALGCAGASGSTLAWSGILALCPFFSLRQPQAAIRTRSTCPQDKDLLHPPQDDGWSTCRSDSSVWVTVSHAFGLYALLKFWATSLLLMYTFATNSPANIQES
ncbi:hypothetical protein E4U54_002932, partial [Claviceps lovelessii]